MIDNKNSGYREINIDQVKQIMKDDFKFFSKVPDNVFCSKCLATSIADYSIYLDDHGDIVLRGFCAKCRKNVARVIETGDDPKTANRAKKIYRALI